MNMISLFSLGQTALELGLICGLTALALFLSYQMLGICDLSTDGCFTLGAAVGAVIAASGHPYLSIPAAMTAGAVSGFVTAFLQTKLQVESLLSGIIVNTALYSVNIAVMGGASVINLNKTDTVFSFAGALLEGTAFASFSRLLVALTAVSVIGILLVLFLRTRLGLAIRATGDNPHMVRASSINPAFTTTIGLCLAGSVTALSGCLLAQSQKAVDINLGTGMVTIALASLLIGRTFLGKGTIAVRAVGVVLGSVLFRLVYTAALRFDLPAYMLKLVSAVIVMLAIAGPQLKHALPQLRRRLGKGGRAC